MKELEHGAIILAKENAQLKQQIADQLQTIQHLEEKVKALQKAVSMGPRGLPWNQIIR